MVLGQLTSHNQNNETGPLFLIINTWKLTRNWCSLENKQTASKTA